VINMAEQRARRAAVLEEGKKARLAVRELAKEERAAINAAEKEEQYLRRETVKLVIKEVGKAVGRAGLRARDGPGKEAWRALDVYVKHKGEIYNPEIQEGIDLDYDEIDQYVSGRLYFIQIVAICKEEFTFKEARLA
jgi:hypothetical protein